MVRQMLMMVCCVLTLALLGPTDSAPQLTVTPDTIKVDLTRSLEVNCTFSYQNPSNISNLISVIVSKTDDHDNNTPVFQELASLNQFSPDKVNIITPVKASITGEINVDGTSYLSLQWANPSIEVAGLYRCSALGLDTSGHPVEEQQTKQVTASRPSTNQLIEMVKLQQIQMDNMMKDLTKYQSLFLTTLSQSYVNSSDYQGRHYLLSKEDLDTDRQSQASCLLQGGYLAEINDVNEHSFIKSFLNSSAPQSRTRVLVGARQKYPGTWALSHSGQLVRYTDFVPGSSWNGQCMYLVRSRSSGWPMVSDSCSVGSVSFTFLCEIPNL